MDLKAVNAETQCKTFGVLFVSCFVVARGASIHTLSISLSIWPSDFWPFVTTNLIKVNGVRYPRTSFWTIKNRHHRSPRNQITRGASTRSTFASTPLCRVQYAITRGDGPFRIILQPACVRWRVLFCHSIREYLKVPARDLSYWVIGHVLSFWLVFLQRPFAHSRVCSNEYLWERGWND